MPLAAGIRLGPYEILGFLGAGGMGEVYRARDTRLDRTVAIKVLPAEVTADPERHRRFEREARAISSLSHPHICTLHDIGRQDGLDYIVMEHLEGGSLADRLKRGPLPLDQALRHGVEIADALDKAHRQGVVHRDLKPANVMLTKSGAKLLDFGLAKLATSAEGQDEKEASSLPTREKPLTEKGSLLGTVQYMAPEQLEGKDADARTDIFALGSILYEMATGRRAFEGQSKASLIGSIMNAEPKPISTLNPLTPAALGRLVSACLAKDPDDRLQTAHDVMLELRGIQEELSHPNGAVVAKPRFFNRERTAWMAATTALVLVALGQALHRPKPTTGRGRPIRFTVSPEPGTSLGETTVALSPDGERLAFVATTAEGKTSLWVRELDALASRELPGTEGASYPFWSPDGRALGFFAQGKMLKVQAGGGPAQAICDAPDGRGGTWSRDGVIVFSPASRSTLSRAPAAGGPPVALTTFLPGQSSHRWPRFLPDGRHFLYMVYGGREETRGIYVGALDSRDARRVSDALSMPAYAPPGFLLFVRDDSVVAQPLDGERLEPRGEPSLVAPSAWSMFDEVGGLTALAASDGGTLAYRGAVPRQPYRLVWLDRSGREVSTLPCDGCSGVRLSPDGQRVLTNRIGEYGIGSLWVFDLKRFTSLRLTVPPAEAFEGVWSPDGSRVVFDWNREGVDDLYEKASDGAGEERLVLHTDQAKYPYCWSPDGRILVFGSLGPETGQDIWTLPMTSDRTPTALVHTRASESAAQLSPDGRWLAYVSDESGRPEVYVQAFPSAEKRWAVSANTGFAPQWRPDGREIFYVSHRNELMAADVGQGRGGFESGTPRPLFRVPVYLLNWRGLPVYAAAPDGQRFLVSVVPDHSASGPIVVTLNWAAQLTAPH